MALVICAWMWGNKYGRAYVDRLVVGLRRHLRQPHRFILAEPHPDDLYLTALPGCLCRLRMFSPEWQHRNRIGSGDRFVCIDLDVIVTGELDPLFDRPESFCILQGANAANPCPFNGSLMMLRGREHPEVWSDFTLPAVRRVPYYEFPDDQGWLWHKLPKAAGWRVGSASGVYAFQKPGWPRGDSLPGDARLVVFPGWRSPERFTHLPWVRDRWAA